jgi:hypothetical protein
MKYWIGVASKNHVLRGIEGKFAQLGHGKRSGLARLQKDDWLVYYSPRTTLEGGEMVQAFTALGQVTDEVVYQVCQSESFCPYRRNVQYLETQEAKILPLLEGLSFIKDPKRWGYPFRTGQLEIAPADFKLIAAAMGIGHITSIGSTHSLGWTID